MDTRNRFHSRLRCRLDQPVARLAQAFADSGDRRPRPARGLAPLAVWLLAGLLAHTLPAAAGPATGHSHVHGQGRLDLILDARTLRLEAELPMETLTGFERAPRTDDERQRLSRALEALRAPGLFRPTPEAACKPTLQTLRWSGSGEPATAIGGLPSDETHTDILVTHEFECERPARLAAVEVGLFDALSRLRRIETRIAGPAGAQARTLQRNRRVLEIGR